MRIANIIISKFSLLQKPMFKILFEMLGFLEYEHWNLFIILISTFIILISTSCTNFFFLHSKKFKFLHCLGLIDMLSANQNAEIFVCKYCMTQGASRGSKAISFVL